MDELITVADQLPPDRLKERLSEIVPEFTPGETPAMDNGALSPAQSRMQQPVPGGARPSAVAVPRPSTSEA